MRAEPVQEEGGAVGPHKRSLCDTWTWGRLAGLPQHWATLQALVGPQPPLPEPGTWRRYWGRSGARPGGVGLLAPAGRSTALNAETPLQSTLWHLAEPHVVTWGWEPLGPLGSYLFSRWDIRA